MDGIRSLLFVPADNERKITKALSSGADAIILDLEDSVTPERRQVAREVCAATLGGERGGKVVFVRINGLGSGDALADLAAVVGGKPYGIMLPKCLSADDVRLLHNYLSALEARDDIPVGATKIVPVATESAASLHGTATYNEDTPRLAGLVWGGEDLAADIGARENRDREGRYTLPYELARTFCLLAATSARVAAIDAVYTDFRDPVGLRREAADAARDGFTAKAAIHPDQIGVINEVFTPSDAEVAHAHRVVDLFRGAGSAGVVELDGRMLDRPHLLLAKRLLTRAR